MKPLILAASVLTASMALAACHKEVKAPDTPGVCYQAVPRANGTITFNQLTAHEDTMEGCAGSLEGMRQRFLGLAVLYRHAVPVPGAHRRWSAGVAGGGAAATATAVVDKNVTRTLTDERHRRPKGPAVNSTERDIVEEKADGRQRQ